MFALPITGDFNGDGITDVGIYQPDQDHFYLDYLNNQAQSIGQVNAPYGFHTPGVFAVPITDDFNGDGIDDVGIYQPDQDHFYLDYLNNQAQSIGQVDAPYGFHTNGVYAIPLPTSAGPVAAGNQIASRSVSSVSASDYDFGGTALALSVGASNGTTAAAVSPAPAVAPTRVRPNQAALRKAASHRVHLTGRPKDPLHDKALAAVLSHSRHRGVSHREPRS